MRHKSSTLAFVHTAVSCLDAFECCGKPPQNQQHNTEKYNKTDTELTAKEFAEPIRAKDSRSQVDGHVRTTASRISGLLTETTRQVLNATVLR